MKRGRPQLLPLLDIHKHIVKLLMAAFRGSDRRFGGYWNIFETKAPEEVAILCRHLSERGHSVFIGQCEPDEPHSYVSRIIDGRRHEKFPKVRQHARQVFLSRYIAVGGYISDKTWKRAESRQGENNALPELFLGQNPENKRP